MASPQRSKCKKMPPQECIDRLRDELDRTQRGYAILETIAEKVIEKITIWQNTDQPLNERMILNMLDNGLTLAQAELEITIHPVDEIAKMYCERCQSFLSQASESAGYCLRCERR